MEEREPGASVWTWRKLDVRPRLQQERWGGGSATEGCGAWAEGEGTDRVEHLLSIGHGAWVSYICWEVEISK